MQIYKKNTWICSHFEIMLITILRLRHVKPWSRYHTEITQTSIENGCSSSTKSQNCNGFQSSQRMQLLWQTWNLKNACVGEFLRRLRYVNMCVGCCSKVLEWRKLPHFTQIQTYKTLWKQKFSWTLHFRHSKYTKSMQKVCMVKIYEKTKEFCGHFGFM